MIQLAVLCLCFLVALGITQDSIFYGLIPAGHTVNSLPVFNTLADVFYLAIIAVIAALAAANIAASRFMMVVLAPKERLSEFFGLFAMSSTATVWIGPILISIFTNASNNQRIGFSPVLLLLLVGLVLMTTLKKTTGDKVSGAAAPPVAGH
jgi:UMF1 family MFS transporter